LGVVWGKYRHGSSLKLVDRKPDSITT
jgi:hypothetical protein